MTQPVWTTASGDLGIYPAGVPLSISLVAEPIFPATLVQYKLLSGSLPNGTKDSPIIIDMFGTITGTPNNIPTRETHNFTVRVTDDQNNIRDRTFSITITASNSPKFTRRSGELVNTIDSVYVSYPLDYVNVIADNKITFSIPSGVLPPGLYLTEDGIIKGYAEPPTLTDRSPTIKSYTFSIQIASNLGNDLVSYSITVSNQRLHRPPNTRLPVILNRKPLNEPITNSNMFYDYYLLNDRPIATISANEYFAFKIIGHDFDNSDIIYQFGGLPPGLVGDNNTGWISGVPIQSFNSISSFEINICVAKKSNTSIVSAHEFFYIVVTNDIKQDIEWITTAELGTVNNGTISALSLEATSTYPLYYRVISGNLPPNLTLEETGEISGRIAEQPTTSLLKEGDETSYTFVAQAYSVDYPLVQSNRTFNVTVHQYYPEPIENIYIKAAPDLTGKRVIQSLLTDDTIIPQEYLYRANDVFFGKASDVSFVHVFGITSSTISEYINAVQTSHYRKKIILGPLETAVAKDDNNNIIYEVVYSKIIDDSDNIDGVSIPQTIKWKPTVSLNLGPYTINNTSINSNSSLYHTNLSPGKITYLYPGSLQNMRAKVTSIIPQQNDSALLPLWMTTQQRDSNNLGFVQAWVICYTKPEKSEIVKNNIETNWPHTLNEIDFTIDRYIVDKSATFDWNTNLASAGWTTLPSGTPVPTPLNTHDISILFPRKTILPKDIEY